MFDVRPKGASPHSSRTAGLALLLAGCASVACAETLASVDWFERPLGDGVVWRYYRFDDLYGAKQSICYIEADLGNPNVSVEFPYLAASRGLTSSIVPAQFPGAAAGANGTFFDTAAGGGGHETYLRVNNTVIPQKPPSKGAWSWNSAITVTASGAASIIPMPAGGWVNDVTHPDIMANGPMLTNAGTVPTATFNSIGSHCTSRNPRTAFGVTADNRLILVAVDGRTDDAAGMTCQELADLMLALGCPDSISMDGGGSTTLWGRGQLYNGVLNYPSDNGAYDHLGERACSNAVAVVAPTTSPLQLDGRITAISYSGTMTAGTSQTVTITYQNIGSQSWSSADTRLVTSRPENHASDLYTTGSWVSPSAPAPLAPSTVANGASGSFSFVITAPQVPSTTIFAENFQLVRDGTGRFGPANNEARLKIAVNPPSSGTGATFLVESRLGGQNYAWYSDSGMADTSSNCTATSATPTIGMRYGSTYRSVAGAKAATWGPLFPASGFYRVYVAWGAGSNRKNPITYRVNHAAGTDIFHLDQSSAANIWFQLGAGTFQFNIGAGGTVQMTNENIDVSGNMFAGPVMFEFVAPVSTAAGDWMLY